MRQITEIKRKDSSGADYASAVNTPDHSSIVVGSGGVLRSFSHMASRTNFAELPAAAVAAATDKLLITVGTGTEVIARSTTAKGRGVNIKTQVTTPADADNVLLLPPTGGGFINAVDDLTLIRFSTKLSLAQITLMLASAGLSELLTDPNPTETAGEGALFLADPEETVTTGLTAAQHANWILAYKVAGVDTFAATTIPLVVDRPYDLDVQLNEDLTASMYINGVLVGTSPALTDGDAINPFIALETNTGAQRDADVRFVMFGPTVVL